MKETKAQILQAKVMHKRFLPKINEFNYGAYYIDMPIKLRSNTALNYNKFGLLSFHEKDHGNRNGDDIEAWARNILQQYNINDAIKHINLVTMPRVLGYVFNPVSFWLCLDENFILKAVISEVNNTFNETHSYICFHDDLREIKSNDWMMAEKLFYVSPFIKREGYYKFRFNYDNEKLGVWIDYYNPQDEKILATALTGKKVDLNKHNLNKMFVNYPLLTFKVIVLIHWQAIKLLIKKIKYITRPKQLTNKLSKSENFVE